MANAKPEVKALACEVIAFNNDDSGVRWILHDRARSGSG
jgi:hydroxymethylpyrimidine pyrophosphatase-like HAD family hydrolase